MASFSSEPAFMNHRALTPSGSRRVESRPGVGGSPLPTRAAIQLPGQWGRGWGGSLEAFRTQTQASPSKNHLYSHTDLRCRPWDCWEAMTGLPQTGPSNPQLGPLELGSLTEWVALWPLSRCHRWVRDCLCTGPGNAEAAGGGSAFAWGGKGVAAQIQTQAPACLQEE